MGSGKKRKQNKSGQNGGFVFHGDLKADRDMNFFNNQNAGEVAINQNASLGDWKEFNELFRSFKAEVQQAALPEQQTQAEEKIQELHAELSKGQEASGDRLSKIVDGLVEMVPGALSAVVSMFASPILGGLVGPVTKMVLQHIQK